MIEEIEKLKADGKRAIVPLGNARAFHYCQVGGDIARSAKTVAALRKGHTSTAAGTVRTGQIPGIESRLASRLHEKRVWIRCCRTIGLHRKLRGQARNRGSRGRRTFATRSRWAERSNRHGINRSKNVVIHQTAGLRKVNRRVRETGARKDCP